METGSDQNEQSNRAGAVLPVLKKPANDLKSLDERYAETLASARFWKDMPNARIREQTFLERVRRAEMLKIVARLERMLGRPI